MSAAKDPSLYNAAGQLHVGRMLHRANNAEDMPEQSWCNVTGESFDTRIGPDYATNKKKGASKPCIYECAAVDIYTTDSKISHVGRLVDLPGEHVDDSDNNGYLPATFIVNFQLPNYPLENAIWGACAGDGPGYSIVFYFVLSAYGREQVKRRGKLESAADDFESPFHGTLSGSSSAQSTPKQRSTSMAGGFGSMLGFGHKHHDAAAASSSSSSNYYSHTDPSCFRDTTAPCNAAVRLLHHFVAADEGTELRQRFKAITRMMNVDEVGLGAAPKKLVTMYNGTPFLIRTCSVFWRGERYFEVDVDVHRFSYTARLGLSGVRERIKDVVFDFGFVIEGHSDFELPENMLGAVRISKLDLTQAKPFPA